MDKIALNLVQNDNKKTEYTTKYERMKERRANMRGRTNFLQYAADDYQCGSEREAARQRTQDITINKAPYSE